MAKLPHVMTDMNAFLKDDTFAGHINKLTLPKVVFKTVDKILSGAAGTIERNLGRLEKMSSEIEIEAFDERITDMVGTNASREELLICKAAVDVDGGHVQAIVRFSGFWKSLDLGEWKPEGEVLTKAEVAIEHFEFELAGKELIYVDQLTNVVRINGVDITKDIRACIGQ